MTDTEQLARISATLGASAANIVIAAASLSTAKGEAMIDDLAANMKLEAARVRAIKNAAEAAHAKNHPTNA